MPSPQAPASTPSWLPASAWTPPAPASPPTRRTPPGTRHLTRRRGNGETMLTAEAAVDTEHPSRYLVQLCTHASKMGGHVPHRPRSHAGGGDQPPEMRYAEWTDTEGIVTLSWGRWTMHATPGTLTLRAEADSEENLRRIQELVTARLEKFGRRDHLTVNWHRTQAPAAAPGEPARPPAVPGERGAARAWC